MATIGTVLDGPHMPATDMAETVTIAKSDLCVGQLQSARMKDETGFLTMLEVFDTEVRKDVRRQMKKLIAEEERKIFVTGPGGTGKSFNLARFVMELRSAGHVVVYVPTMENLLRDPMNLLDELVHAVKMATPSDDLTVKLPDEDQDSAVLMRLIHKAFKSRAEKCKASGKRLVLVIDQDNLLWKRISYDPLFVDLDRLILSLPCQLILCASANNEGWERRTCTTRVYHGIDKVPLSVLTAMGASPSEVEFLERYFGLYPLDTLAALKLATEQGATKHLRFEALVKYQDICATTIETSHRAFLEAFPEAWDGAFHEASIGSGRYNSRFDRRFLTKHINEPLRALHPVALSALIESAEQYALGREGSRLALAKFVVDSANKVPSGFFYELMFANAAGGLFNPAASAAYHEFVVEKSLYDVPAKAIIDTFRHKSPPSAKMLVKSPARSQAVDFYLLEKLDDDETKVRAIAIQVTVNKEHAATHEVFVGKVRDYVNPPSTMYEQLEKNGVDSICFLYVTDSPSALGVASWTKLGKSSKCGKKPTAVQNQQTKHQKKTKCGNLAPSKSKSISMLLINNVDVCAAQVPVSPEATLKVYRAVIPKDFLRDEFNRMIVEGNFVIKKTEQLVAPTTSVNTDGAAKERR